MKKRTRNILLIIIALIGISALAAADILSNSTLTTGFLGMVVLISGTLIIPTSIDLIKQKEK